jgi:preprotein translocase subunit SecG
VGAASSAGASAGAGSAVFGAQAAISNMPINKAARVTNILFFIWFLLKICF